MKITSKYTLGFKRKRKGQTDYRKRLRILTSKKPRLVVRKSLNAINASIVEFNTKGDVVKSYAHSNQLKKMGWKFSFIKHACSISCRVSAWKSVSVKAGVKEAVFDTGLQKAIKRGETLCGSCRSY